MPSSLVELHLCKFTDLVSRVSLANNIVYLLYACTPTSISSSIFVFEYFLHTFPITLIFDEEMFAFVNKAIFIWCVSLCNYRQVLLLLLLLLLLLFNNLNMIIFEHLQCCARDAVYFIVTNL
jgi:hypothetical protein